MIIFVGQIILVSEHFVGNLFFPFLSIFTNIANITIDMPQGKKKGKSRVHLPLWLL